MAKFLFIDNKLINILTTEEDASGGAAVQAYAWICGLIDLGHDVYCLTETTEQPLKQNIKNIQLLPWFDKKKGLRWIRWVTYRIPYFFKIIQNVNPDYIYQGIPNWNTFVIGYFCKIWGTKYILRISNDYFFNEKFKNKHGKVHRFFIKRGLMSANYIFCQNDFQYNSLIKSFSDKKVIKLTNPIILANGKKEATNSRVYIAWVGLFQYQKNMKLLYSIASEFKHETFLIAGKESSKCDQETLVFIKKLKSLNNVKFTGFLKRAQVSDFMANAKFLLNTSHYEGFSNTFLEAMVVGTPIITSIAVNPDKIIDKFKMGLVYRDLPDLLRQYKQLDMEQYSRMSKNARFYVNQNHDNVMLSQKLVDIVGADKY